MKNELYLDLWKTIKDGRTWKGEIKNIAQDGTIYYVEAIITPTTDIHGELIGYSSIRHDVTDKKRIETLSITDQLTGLYNRRRFNDTFLLEIKRAIRKKAFLSFAMLDLDFFKQYNDIYGHQEGDKVLSAIGKILKTRLQRPEDFSFRLGGEEFSMVFSSDSCQSSELIAQSVCDAVRELNIEHKGSKVHSAVTVSIGLVCVDFSKESSWSLSDEKLYKIADDELYKAKSKGRNRVSLLKL
jgi:diguanylate cyclase (GGDEF)-like protein